MEIPLYQNDVPNIFRELGGRATLEQIRQRTLEKNPGRTLDLYYTNRPTKLGTGGIVAREEVSLPEKKAERPRRKGQSTAAGARPTMTVYWNIIDDVRRG